jgi:formamidopyrimidine-DNA glycosylase
MQAGFPGIGNWMADEILWQAGIHPRRHAGSLNKAELRRLFARVRSVTRTSLRTIGADWGDVPKTWLFSRRWRPGGSCPKDQTTLRRATIGGRTTCWCPTCQVDRKRVKS